MYLLYVPFVILKKNRVSICFIIAHSLNLFGQKLQCWYSFVVNVFYNLQKLSFFLSDFHSANVNLDYTVLLFCLLGKFQLHKARTIRCNPNFRMFSLDIKSLVTFFKNMSKL